MPVNESLLRSCLELIVDPCWWYSRMVDYYAEAFSVVGGGHLIIQTIETVLHDCKVRSQQLTLGRSFAVAFDHGQDFFAALAESCRTNQVRQGFIPVFIAGFSEVTIVGTCENSRTRTRRFGPRST